MTLDEHHIGTRTPGEFADLAGEHRQRLVHRPTHQQPRVDGCHCGEPSLAGEGALEQARVLDGHTGGHREDLEDHLVLLGELGCAQLLGEVDAAEDLAAHHDRSSEEALHGRVVGRESDGGGMLRQVGEADRPGIVDEQTEDAPALGQVAHHLALRRVDAHVHELRQTTVGGAHAERAVAGVEKGGRRGDDALEHGIEFETRSHDEHRFEQSAQGRRGVDGVVEPVAELGEQRVDGDVGGFDHEFFSSSRCSAADTADSEGSVFARLRSCAAPVTSTRVVAAGRRSSASRSSSKVPKGSRSPWTNTVGTEIFGRCSVRSFSGLPGGWRG